MKISKKYFLVVAVAGLLLANLVNAADIVSAPGKEDPTVTIGSAEKHHNLYTAASTVMVNGMTTGDAFVAGGTVTQNGDVEQDLFMAGGTIVVNGKVGGDLRLAGGTVSVNSPVAGDLLLAGGNISITDKSSVGGDLLLAGGNVDISAPVAGSAKFAGGNIKINSKITGDVWVQSSDSLVFGPNAEVSGKIVYHGKRQAVIQEGAKVSAIEFTQIKTQQKDFRGLITGFILVKFLAMILALLVLVNLIPRRLSSALEAAQTKPWVSLGVGFLALIVTPIAIVIAFITLVGYYLAFMVLVAYLLLILVSASVAALYVGHLVVKLLTKKQGVILDWQSALIGGAVFMLIGLVPIVGWLACFVLVMMAFGATLLSLKQEIN